MQLAVSQSESRYLHKICKGRNKKFSRCSPFVKSSHIVEEYPQTNKIMSSSNPPEKIDPKPPSIIVNTSTQTGNVNVNVVVNRVQSQPPSMSSDSDFEVIPPEKITPKRIFLKKKNINISFPHQFPGLSYPLVNNDKWIYSVLPVDNRIVKKIVYPEILSLKSVEANLEKDPFLKTIRDAIRAKKPRAKETIAKLGQYYAQHYND